MTRKERREYILALNKVVNRWKENSNLFAGGCCFSAGQIAKLLEEKDIRYQVVCWKCWDYKEKNLMETVVKANCVHVGIQVELDGKPFVIGGNYGGIWSCDIKIFKRMHSKQIMACDVIGLALDSWNDMYNRNLNRRFINVLTKAVGGKIK